jgi:hypothetical protein
MTPDIALVIEHVKTGLQSKVATARRYTVISPVFTIMHFKLICLYKDGVPLDKDALAETPVQVGNLVIEDGLTAAHSSVQCVTPSCSPKRT